MSRLPEQLAWDAFKRASVKSNVAFWRIENLHGDGMSDVYAMNMHGTSAWMEFKALETWPVRNTTCPLKGAFEPGQIPFLQTIASRKGNAWVVLRVGKDDWSFIPPHCGGKRPDELTQLEIRSYNIALTLKHFLIMLEDL